LKNRLLFLLALSLISKFGMTQNEVKPTIIYVGDPMCSWCYGISGELVKLKSDLGSSYDFQLIVGGLRPGGGDAWDTEFKNFLKHHWEDVSKASGQPFNFDILNTDEFNYDTEPSCRAVVIARDMKPDIAFDFFADVQKGFYVKNQDPKTADFYKDICSKYDLDFSEFNQKFSSVEYKEKTKKDFSSAGQMGVRGFPTILLKENGALKVIANGFAPYKTLKSRILQN
jgi:putative protein-disulfide isomerase